MVSVRWRVPSARRERRRDAARRSPGTSKPSAKVASRLERARGERGDRRRVEAAGEEDADRHVAHQRGGHGPLEVGAQRRAAASSSRSSAGRGRGAARPPSSGRRAGSRPSSTSRPPGGSCGDAANALAGAATQPVRRYAAERGPVRASPAVSARREQRLRLGGEHEPPAGDGVVERLLAEPVARQDEPARGARPTPRPRTCRRARRRSPGRAPRRDAG